MRLLRIPEKSHFSDEKTEDATSALTLSPRPSILNGTFISTRQYLSILYNMATNMTKNVNINRDVPLFNTQIPLTKILNYVSPSVEIARKAKRLAREGARKPTPTSPSCFVLCS